MKKKWIIQILRWFFVLCISIPLFGKITQNEEFLKSFTGLGYPVYLSYILALAYILGLLTLFQSKFKTLKEWAYAGFTFALIGAFLSHLFKSQLGMGLWAIITLSLLLASYFIENKTIASQ